MRAIYIRFLFILCSGTFLSAYAAEAGRVIAVTPNVFLVENGKTKALALKDSISDRAVIRSDAQGRAQILLKDNTTIAIAPNTQIQIEDFVFGNAHKQPSFAMRVSAGVSRVATGKIVKQNRNGFKISTPHASVGIRGTIVTTTVGEKTTNVLVNQIGVNEVVVTNTVTGQINTINTSGMLVEARPEGNLQRPATQQEMTTSQTIARNHSAVPQQNNATSGTSEGNAPTATSSNGAANGNATTNNAATASNDVMAAQVMETGKVENATGGMGAEGAFNASTTPIVTPPTPTLSFSNALYKGALSGAGVGQASRISFNVNLTSGLINQGSLYVVKGTAGSLVGNGTGMLSGNNFQIGNFQLHTSTIPDGSSSKLITTLGSASVNGNLSSDRLQADITHWELNGSKGSQNVSLSGTGSASLAGTANDSNTPVAPIAFYSGNLNNQANQPASMSLNLNTGAISNASMQIVSPNNALGTFYAGGGTGQVQGSSFNISNFGQLASQAGHTIQSAQMAGSVANDRNSVTVDQAKFQVNPIGQSNIANVQTNGPSTLDRGMSATPPISP